MTAMATAKSNRISPQHTVFLICDMQARFRNIIFGFEHVLATTNKMLKVAQTLGIRVIASEHHSDKFGKTIPELDFASLGLLHLATLQKSMFSLITPDMTSLLAQPHPDEIKSVVLFGLETHICVLQTALELIDLGFDVHVVADGVSSVNKEEVPWAFERMREAGVHIVTSEALAFQLMRDSADPRFRTFQHAIKDARDDYKAALGELLPARDSDTVKVVDSASGTAHL